MNTKQRYQMVVESNLSLATVAKWDKGETVNQVMADHLERIAKKLGLLEKRGEEAVSGRIRTIKPEWLEDERMVACSADARVMSIALILLADDYGRGRANHSWLGGQVFPSKDDATDLVAESLKELSEMRYVTLYHVRGQSYFEIRNWVKHQRVDKPGKPRVPPPGEEQQEATVITRKAVYFVQGESTGLIKIGESVDPVSRITELAKCGSENLLLLAIVANGSRTERELHAKLSESRIHGEWFNPTQEVLNEVELAGGDICKPLARFGYDSERRIREPFRSDSRNRSGIIRD